MSFEIIPQKNHTNNKIIKYFELRSILIIIPVHKNNVNSGEK